MAAENIAGTAYFRADGRQFAVGESVTVSLDSVEREGVVGLSGVAGYNEKFRQPYIEGEVFLTGDLKLAEIEALTDATIVVESGGGRVFTLRNAWSAGARELAVADGKMTVRFEGMSGEEAS